MSGEGLRAAFASFAGTRIAVFGDLMLDEYVWGDVVRISPDAPVPVVRIRRRSHAIGGAGNVAHNLVAAGAQPMLFGVVGDDLPGTTFENSARLQGIDVSNIVRDPDRPTTVKTRVVARGQHLLRLDDERTAPIPDGARAALLDRLERGLPGCAALLVSDYAKGVVDAATFAEVRAIAARVAPGVPVVVDPKSRDFTTYRGATALTPNRKEAEEASGLSLDDDVAFEEAGRRLREAAAAAHVLITLGDRGMALVGQDGIVDILPAESREVHDVTGAGDTVLAYFGLGLAVGLPAHDAAGLANAAAGIVVGKVGTAAVAPSEILAEELHRTGAPEKFLELLQAVARVERERSLGRRIVFTNGCFDLLHAGHVQLLQAARRLGDLLVVALNSDKSVRRLKGAGRPVVQQDDRVKMLCALDAVGVVVVFDQDTPLEVIQKIRPDVLAKGGDYTVSAIVGADVVTGYGGAVLTIPLVEGRSTSGLLESIRKREDDGR